MVETPDDVSLKGDALEAVAEKELSIEGVEDRIPVSVVIGKVVVLTATVRVEVLLSTITVDVLEKSTLVGMTGTV